MAIDSAILWLRRIVSCFSFTLAVLFAALWVRSYFYREVGARITSHSQATAQISKGIVSGEVYFGRKRFNTYTSTVYQFRSTPAGPGWPRYDNGFLGFYWRHYGGKSQHIIEYRFLFGPIVLALTACTYAVRPKPRFRFGLIDLAMLTTMMAVAVGLTVSLVNSSGLFG